MRKTDITGQPLPVLLVSGFSVYPPNLGTVKAASVLGDILSSVISQTVSETQLNELFCVLREILNNNAEGKDFTLKELIKQPFEDVVNVIRAYAVFIQNIRDAHPMPEVHFKSDEGADYSFESSLSWDKIVADYANMKITEVQKLNYVDYIILRREALISSLSKTEEGREMLEDAFCYEQTEPDRAALRQQFGGGSYA